MDSENEMIFDTEEINEPIKCKSCGWDGLESELEEDYYDSFNMSCPIACYCPKCGSDNIE